MIPVVRVKSGVRFDVIGPAGFALLGVIQSLPGLLNKDITITCGTDFHTAPDPHCSGEAYDIAVTGLTADDIHKVMDRFHDMGPRFYAQLEVPQGYVVDPSLKSMAVVNAHATGPHMHAQRAKDTSYP